MDDYVFFNRPFRTWNSPETPMPANCYRCISCLCYHYLFSGQGGRTRGQKTGTRAYINIVVLLISSEDPWALIKRWRALFSHSEFLSRENSQRYLLTMLVEYCRFPDQRKGGQCMFSYRLSEAAWYRNKKVKNEYFFVEFGYFLICWGREIEPSCYIENDTNACASIVKAR